MRALIQRVSEASVSVDGEVTGAIDRGLLVLLGVDREDDNDKACKLMDKLLAYRVFPDDEGRMNRSVTDIAGGVLLVSQFTLSADTRKGLRPSFSSAAPPERARSVYDHCLTYLKQQIDTVETGIFAADMQVSLINDGPVTFLLEV